MNTAVATRENTEVVSPAAQDGGANSILAVIERATRDPSVDVDKMERLLGMYERVSARDAKAAYIAALANVQLDLPTITERGEIKIGSGPGQKYAKWEDINDAIKPILKQHGFALSFRTGAEDAKIKVTGVLSHIGGHSEETSIYLPSDTSGSKNAVQAVGSSTSYGKRYTTIALLNITSRGEDDDGHGAGTGELISEEQAESILDRLNACGADIPVYCKYMGVPSVKDIPKKQYSRALAAIAKKEQAARK